MGEESDPRCNLLNSLITGISCDSDEIMHYCYDHLVISVRG